MSDKNNCCETGANVSVDVDVTKIVKYACMTGAFIVVVVFAAKCIGKFLKME